MKVNIMDIEWFKIKRQLKSKLIFFIPNHQRYKYETTKWKKNRTKQTRTQMGDMRMYVLTQ